MRRSSAAGLKAPSGPRLRVHSMCTAPGIAPPRAARTVVPQYSPSLRVSSRTLRLADRAAHVLPGRDGLRHARPLPLADRRRRRLARNRKPSLSRRRTRRRAAAPTDGRSIEKPERAGGANARLIVVDNDRRRRLDAASREQVLDHPHERLERRRVGVDQADAEEVEMNGAGDVSGGVGLGRPEIEEQGAGRARLADDSRQFLGRDQQLGVRIPFHPAIVQHSWFRVQRSRFHGSDVHGSRTTEPRRSTRHISKRSAPRTAPRTRRRARCTSRPRPVQSFRTA